MQHSSQIRVLEFGSSVFGTEAGLPAAVQEIYREWRDGHAVVAIASTSTADELLQRAQQLGLPPQPGASALLTLALRRSGLPATLLDPIDIDQFQSGIAVASAAPRGVRGPKRSAPNLREPLRVALLGCGTVGGGVLPRLLALPEVFRVVGVAVQDLKKHERLGVPLSLLTSDVDRLVEREADVVVELMGGREPAGRAIVRALELGRSVVTANKLLLADGIDALSRLAKRHGGSLRYSASVGGALPALETVRPLKGRIRALSGVLNGTCNYILDRCAAGVPFDEAVAAAQAAGFAEADPTLDLDGSDSAQKLALLVREAFGAELRWDQIPRRGIVGLDAGHGRIVRLVASCEQSGSGLQASVQPVELPLSHPFARTTGADNALRIEMLDRGTLDLSAQGAGRWPTCEAVLADLYDVIAEVAA